MKRLLSSAGFLTVLGLGSVSGCAGAFGTDPPNLHLEVALADGTDRGTREARKVIAVDPPDSYVFSVRAVNAAGDLDTSYDGWLRISVKPGNVVAVSGNDVDGRNVHLTGGHADNIQVDLSRAYGDTRIVVDDLGYTPVDPQRDPPPGCADGKDNDGDGDIDFPADFECAFANDDSETGGTYAAGASDPVFYKLPRAAEIHGYPSGAYTPFKSQSVQVDTGYRDETRDYDFTMVVTRISSDGFYVADLEDDRAPEDRTGFDGLFAFNFNAPFDLGYCDQLRRLSGTATEFFGSIQLGYPTWSASAWDGKPEHCLIPEPYWFNAVELTSPTADRTKLKYTHSLVRVMSGDQDTVDANGVPVTYRTEVHIGSHLGPDHPTQDNGKWILTDNATNCDFNGDSVIDFSADPEKGCAAACDADVECTEYSNFSTRANFQFAITSSVLLNGQPQGTPARTKLQGNGSTAPEFVAAPLRGQTIHSFTGTLGYFSGGNQFTIEARCSDDIVIDLATPAVPSNTACITRADAPTDDTQ